MKIIDLLNKIANGEEVPKKIKYLYYEYEFNEEEKEYQRLQNEIIYGLGEDRRLDIVLDDEVKIIEEPQPTKEEIKEYTNNFLEAWTPVKQQFGKLFDELIRIKNDLGLNLEDFTKEEPQEHKIPEKLKASDYKEVQSQFDLDVISRINKILDYLEEIE